MMKLLSINVGQPRQVEWEGQIVRTSIYKTPVEGPVRLRRHNLDGDEQSDQRAHGGPDQAVYAYPFEHYAFWQAELPGTALEFGNFGENLTLQGLLEEKACVGDVYRVGEARLRITAPRIPCYKLEMRLQMPGMIERFLNSRRSGFYLAVEQEGTLRAGDALVLEHKDPHQVSIAELMRIYVLDKNDQEALERALAVETLPENWRRRFQRRMAL